MNFVKVNLPKAGNGAGVTQEKDVNIVIFEWDEVKTFPARDSKGVKLQGNIEFKDGKYAILMYATSSSISTPRTTEGEEDQIGRTSLPEFSHPGSTLEFEEFCENKINTGLGVAVRVYEDEAGESYYKIYGTRGNPLYLMDEGQDNNEAIKNMVRFQQFRPSKHLPARYYGTFTFDEANLVPADAETVNVDSGSGEYQLQDNAAVTAISDLTNAVHGGTYTLIGSGGTNPATIAAGGNFILAGATDWQGVAGARITLKAYSQGETFVFFEQSRSA